MMYRFLPEWFLLRLGRWSQRRSCKARDRGEAVGDLWEKRSRSALSEAARRSWERLTPEEQEERQVKNRESFRVLPNLGDDFCSVYFAPYRGFRFTNITSGDSPGRLFRPSGLETTKPDNNGGWPARDSLREPFE